MKSQGKGTTLRLSQFSEGSEARPCSHLGNDVINYHVAMCTFT